MIRQMVMFRWTPEATREQKERVKDELTRLPALIPQVRAYHIGEALGLAGEINFDFAVAADFDHLGGFVPYRHTPPHRTRVEPFIQPILGPRGAVPSDLRANQRPAGQGPAGRPTRHAPT